jgi:ATP-dependent DNA ligase
VLIDVIHPKLNTYGQKVAHMKSLERAAAIPNLLFTPDFKTSKPEIDQLIEDTKIQGREGVIVTSLTQPEVNNPRVKIKHYRTFNLRVGGITQEYDIKGNPKESAGALICYDASGREVCRVGTGLSREQRIHIWTHPEAWLDKLVQVKAMFHDAHKNPQKTEAYKLMHPVYNGDADGALDTVV